MPPRMYDGGAVLVDGFRYDISKMIDATVLLVDTLTQTFGPCRVTTLHEGFGEMLPWPGTGRKVTREVWLRMAEVYDAVDEPLIFIFDTFVLKAYLFGTSWCVHDTALDALVRPDGVTPIIGIDPLPTIQVWGKGSAVAYLRFTHETFGDGIGPIRIRCISR